MLWLLLLFFPRPVAAFRPSCYDLYFPYTLNPMAKALRWVCPYACTQPSPKPLPVPLCRNLLLSCCCSRPPVSFCPQTPNLNCNPKPSLPLNLCHGPPLSYLPDFAAPGPGPPSSCCCCYWHQQLCLILTLVGALRKATQQSNRHKGGGVTNFISSYSGLQGIRLMQQLMLAERRTICEGHGSPLSLNCL